MTRAWNAYAAAYIPAVILFGAFLVGNAAFMVKLLLGEQFQIITPILIWPALTETFRAISSTLHQLGLAKVDMTVSVLPVVIGALVAPTLVYVLAPYEPLLGSALALLIGGVAVFAVVVPTSRRALPVTWPVIRIMYAVALGLPLCLLGRVMSAGFGVLSESKAVVPLVISGLALVMYQMARQKGWKLPETYSGYAFLSYDSEPLPAKYVTASERLKFRDEAWQQYFPNPGYLKLVATKFGDKERANVEDMATVRLRRKLFGD